MLVLVLVCVCARVRVCFDRVGVSAVLVAIVGADDIRKLRFLGLPKIGTIECQVHTWRLVRLCVCACEHVFERVCERMGMYVRVCARL